MHEHSHISLCDNSWFFYNDYISFDIKKSITQYLNFIFESFNPEGIARSLVEAEIYKRVDEKNRNPIYFRIGDYNFLWMICDNCRMVGLN